VELTLLEVDNSTWAITQPGAKYEFDTEEGLQPAISRINSTHYLLVYRGPDLDGWSVVMEVDPFGWDVSTATYLQNFSVSNEVTNSQGVFFNPDGTQMYVVDTSIGDVTEYNLSIAWNVSNASFVQTSINLGGAPEDLFFRSDGLKMYVVVNTGDNVSEFDLSIAWNVSTATFLQSFSVTDYETGLRGLFFKVDGTKMYILGTNSDHVHEYDLSSAWDISTAAYLQNFSVAGQELNPTGMFFKPDGAKMYVTGFSGQDVNEYDLSTVWNVSSATFLQVSSSMSPRVAQSEGLFFRADGAKMYVVGNTHDNVNEFDLDYWTISEAGAKYEYDATESTSLDVSQIDSNHYLVVYSGPDGDGWSVVLNVSTSDLSITKGTPFEYDTVDSTLNAIAQISSTHYLVTYQGTDSAADGVDGWSVVLEVAGPPINKTIVSKGLDAYALELNEAGNELRGSINSNGVVATISSITDWHHYVLTYNGSNQSLYIDGVYANSSAVSGAISANANDLIIGDKFFGTLDEVKIWKRALTAAEISAEYNRTTSNYLTSHSRTGDVHTFSLNMTNLTDGNYTWIAYANDTANLPSDTSTHVLTVDTVIPAVSLAANTPANNSVFSNDWIFINTTENDDGNDHADFSAFIDFNSSLVGYWRFEQEGGIGTNATDSSSYENAGTLTNFGCTELDCNTSSGWISAGRRGKGLIFDGVNDRVDTEDDVMTTPRQLTNHQLHLPQNLSLGKLPNNE